jgi:hypothetical protein
MNVDGAGRDVENFYRHQPMTLVEAAKHIQHFEQNSLRRRIATLEQSFCQVDRAALAALYPQTGVEPELWTAAQLMKALAGQINVVVHATGILLSLPYILQEDEVIEALSLGAGNTGVPFDLITNRRVAEFKFTHWRGGPESIRKNQLFKDFYLLAEADTSKERFLYVVDEHYPLKFLRSKRSLASVLSRNNALWGAFQAHYGDRFVTVSDYYAYRQGLVTIVDLRKVVPHFMQRESDDTDSNEDIEV